MRDGREYDRAYIAINKIPDDVIQIGEKVTIKVT